MVTEEMMAELERLTAENAALKAAAVDKKEGKLTLRASKVAKAVSIYGLGRMPVTVYPTGAVRLFSPEQARLVNQFVIDHASELSFAKDGTDPEVAAAAKEAVLAAARKNLEE